MSEQFKLVFRGEIENDQHQAVVRKRLGQLLKADDKTLAALFSGQAVVLRKQIDASGAAKFQAAFSKAGARLRVIPCSTGLEDGTAPAAATAPADSTSPAGKPSLAERLRAAAAAAEKEEEAAAAATLPETADPATADAAALRLYPIGAMLLEVHEQLPPAQTDVDVSHLTVAEVGERVGPVVEMMADTDRFLSAAEAFQLAETGADMAPQRTEPELPLPVPDLNLAPTGADLLEGAADAPAPTVSAPVLELSEPGATLIEPAPPRSAPVPDTTHLELLDDPTQD